MKATTLTALAGLSGLLIMSGECKAEYLGLSVELYSTVNVPPNGGTDVDVYRVYARFSAGDDRFYGFDGEAGNPIEIENYTGSPGGTANGSGFFNNGVRATAPTDADMNPATHGLPARRWDTFVTVGVWIAEEGSGPSQAFNQADQTTVDPAFPANFPGGVGVFGSNDFSSTGSVFTVGQETANDPDGNPDNSRIDQNRADYTGDAASGDRPLWVPLLQLTVQSGESVRGTLPVIRVGLGTDAPGTQPTTTYHIADVTSGGHPLSFHVFNIPSPGVLALLGFAGLIGTRRRRMNTV